MTISNSIFWGKKSCVIIFLIIYFKLKLCLFHLVSLFLSKMNDFNQNMPFQCFCWKWVLQTPTEQFWSRPELLFLQLIVRCYFPSHMEGTAINSVIMGYGRHRIHFTVFHKAAFLTRTLLPRALEIKGRQGRSNQVAAVETGTKAGRTFPLMHRAVGGQAMCLAEVKWLHFFKCGRKLTWRYTAKRGMRRWSVLGKKHAWKLLAALPDLQAQQHTV